MTKEYRAFLANLKPGDLVAVCYDGTDTSALPGFVHEAGINVKINMMDYFIEEESIRTFVGGKFEIKSRAFHIIGKDIMDRYTIKEAQPLATFMTNNLNRVYHIDTCELLNNKKCNCAYKDRLKTSKLAINDLYK